LVDRLFGLIGSQIVVALGDMRADKHKAIVGLLLLVKLFNGFGSRIAIFKANIPSIGQKII
jgi:hypothetical protein